MKKSIWILFTAGLSVVMMLSACTKAGNIIYVPDPDEPMASTAPIVTVIYGQDGLGDRSYNDLIYLGVEEAATEYGLRTVELSPTSYEEGRGYLENMFQTVKSNRDTIPHLYIVAAAGYDDYIRKNSSVFDGNPYADLLYLETPEPLASGGYYYGAGIGSGQDASVGTIRIYGGDVTAYGGEDAAGIGTGEEYERDGINSGTIEIFGGKVYAYGKGYGAGIGAGEGATFGLLGISGGYVEAHAGSDCGNWSGGIGAYHKEHDEEGCHIGWAGWERIWIGACMRLWTYSPYNGYWENVHCTENWWNFVHQRPWVAFGECNHVDGAYDITNCPYCHSYTLQLK